MQPRLIRLREAPDYLGMDKNLFNIKVRPHLIQIPIGNHGIAFDRLDLDAWVEQYKHVSGRPGVRRNIWGVNERQVSINVEKPGISTNKSVESAFQKAVARLVLKKQKSTLQEKLKA